MGLEIQVHKSTFRYWFFRFFLISRHSWKTCIRCQKI